MSTATSLSPQRVSELVMANRVIRAPNYDKDHDEGVEFTDLDRGLQWGADVVPAMLGLFRVERDPRDEHPDGWVGFARHWRGGTLRIDFDRYADADTADDVLAVTAMSGKAGEGFVEDEDLGDVELPAEVPTEEEWTERDKRYQSARRRDDADGSASVRAFVAALPAWQRELATRVDEIVEREVPDVRRAVKWHQPFYGVEDEGWFASVSAFSKHVKLSFVCDEYLEPEPPKGNDPTRQALDVKETDELDEAQVADWARQAAGMPGIGW